MQREVPRPVEGGVIAECVGAVKVHWTATGEVHALKGIDLIVPRGEVTAVVGPSGSGKSSLLRLLAAMDRPTAGAVLLAGRDVAGLSRSELRGLRRRKVGYVFQRPSDNLLGHLRVDEHVRHAARVRGVSGVDADALLDDVGLADRRRHYPGQLSGGEQQRLALARAVVGNPWIVVADEPTAELDHRTGATLLEAIQRVATRGSAVVLATHDPMVVQAADQTIHLRRGSVEAETRDGGVLSVIDGTGRVQLPPEALAMFHTRRAILEIHDGEVRLVPPKRAEP